MANLKKFFFSVTCLSVKKTLAFAPCLLPMAITAFAAVYCVGCGEPIGTCVFTGATGLIFYLSNTILCSKRWSEIKVPSISLISSLVATLAVFVWYCATNYGLFLLEFCGACVFGSLGMFCYVCMVTSKNKMEKVFYTLWTIFFFVFSLTFVYEGINMLIVLPEWATTVANVLSYVGASAFALSVGAMAVLLTKVAKEASGGFKPIVKCIAAAMSFTSLCIICSIIFDLLGYEMMPVLLGDILMWGILLSLGCALLIGLCMGVATLCSKPR